MILGKIAFYAGRSVLYARKYGPAIATYLGVPSMAAGTIVACRETRKLDGVLEKCKERLEEAKKENKKKDILKARTKNITDLAMLYLPATILTVGGGTAIILGHCALNSRYVAAAAAYATLNNAFETYKKRVVEKIGEDAERDIRFPTANEVIEKISSDNTETKSTKNEASSQNINKGAYTQYARCFDEYNPYWHDDPEDNRHFLLVQQDRLNDKLHSGRGYVTLNEVLEALGFRPYKGGQFVGWVNRRPGDTQDHYIDFGCWKRNDDNSRLFLNGYESSVWLDFNVDGLILDDIDRINRANKIPEW